jgi:hypothetical protein
LFDISSLDSDQERSIIVFVSIFASADASYRRKRFIDLATSGTVDTLCHSFPLMRFLVLPALLTVFFVAACSEEPPPQRTRHRAASYPPTAPEEYPPPQQPFNPNGPAQPAPREEVAAPPPPTAAPTKVAKGDYPYGIPVPGKPHLVESPYSPGKYVDVEGFPPGTEVKDPYTDKIFLVP